MNIKLPTRALVAIPTYNERKNVLSLTERLLALSIPFDILFVDDNSPDGTGQIIDELRKGHPNIFAIHREGKQGIGTAHLAAIRWAYDREYDVLVTMDCDFTHTPESVARLFSERSEDAQIVLGSRYLTEGSLPGWALTRKFLTRLGHFLTHVLLGMPYDATGALRLYELRRIPRGLFDLVHSRGYSFFFESLFIAFQNNFGIREFPIALPARTYGESKMSYREVLGSVKLLFRTFFIASFCPEKFQYIPPLESSKVRGELVDCQGWDDYWKTGKTQHGLLYDAVAAFYRKRLIGPSLRHFIRRYVAKGASVLHAGCGSGQVDRGISDFVKITALDISLNALDFYRKTHGETANIVHGSIFAIPVEDGAMDAVYNLGVLEHFTEEEIAQILAELRRVVRPGGRLLIFWPPEFGVSVVFFKILTKACALLGKPNVSFHPKEITRLRSRAHAEGIIAAANLNLIRYSFGIRDAGTYVVLVAERPL